MVLNDFNRGKIPWFVPPPRDEDDNDGALGTVEVGRKRPRTANDTGDDQRESQSDDGEDEEWAGFQDDS
jgi:nuclear GTP-binding protein